MVLLLMGMPRLLVEDPSAIEIVGGREESAPVPESPRGLLFRLRRGLLTGIDLCKEGKPEEGLQRIQRVIESSRSWRVRPFLLRGLFWKGYYLEEGGDLQSAEEAYKETVEVFEELLAIQGGEIPVEKIPWVYEKLVALLVKTGKSEEALEYLERSHSKALQEQFARLSVKFADSTKETMVEKAKRLEGALVSSEKELGAELSKPKAEQDQTALERLEKNLSLKQREYSNFIYELKKAHPELAGLFRVDPKDLRRQRSHMPKGMVLIEYLMGEKNLYLFLVSHHDLVVKTVPIAAEDLSAKIEFLLALVSDASLARSLGPLDPENLAPGKADGEALEAVSTFQETSAELYGLLLKPFAEALRGAEIVGIIPNGKLHCLPFEMLGEMKEKSFQPLLKISCIYYLSSLDILAGEAPGGSPRPVAFANADGTLPESEVELQNRIAQQPVSRPQAVNIAEAVSHAARETAQDLDAAAIVTPTVSGHTARMVSRYRPTVPIVAVTPSPMVQRQLCLHWGVYPLLAKRTANTDQMLVDAVNTTREQGLVQPGELVVVTGGAAGSAAGTTNLIKVQVVERILTSGMGIGSNAVQGQVRLIGDPLPKPADIAPSDILVLQRTMRKHVPIVREAAGLVVVEGGSTSHAARMAVELGFSAIVGAEDAFAALEEGQVITLDPNSGRVYEGRVRT